MNWSVACDAFFLGHGPLLDYVLSIRSVPLIAYVPFVDPLPVWDVWYLTLIPLTLGIAVVYKAVKCKDVSQIPRQSLTISVYILGGLVAAALGLWVVVTWMSS